MYFTLHQHDAKKIYFIKINEESNLTYGVTMYLKDKLTELFLNVYVTSRVLTNNIGHCSISRKKHCGKLFTISNVPNRLVGLAAIPITKQITYNLNPEGLINDFASL